MTGVETAAGELPDSTDLDRLAQAYGIATEFWDWRGRHTRVQARTLVDVLAAMDVDASTPAAVAEARSRRDREPWTHLLPACVVTRTGVSTPVTVHVTHGEPVDVWVELEATGTRALRQLEDATAPVELDGRWVGRASFEIPADLPAGYHTLRARSPAGGGPVTQASASLIVTPDRLTGPARLGDRRTWGLATQLYSLRSRQSWGAGDLTDLTDLAVWSAAEHDAGFVLVNPLHAIEPSPPLQPSPYLPTTRRFPSPFYLRVERIAEYADLPDAARAEVRRLHQQARHQLDGVDRIDRDAAWTFKRAALEIVFATGRTVGRHAAFTAYCRREGTALDDFATWCALADAFGGDWTGWPAGLREPTSPEVDRFRREHPDAVEFHRWTQWVLDDQLAAAQSAAVRAGMSLGIVHDLAVGVNPRGADAWGLGDLCAAGMTVGAPPDAFNQAGQDWSQPPWRPDRLAELAYRPFREMVSAVLRHAGGVRVDHILGLFRLWWIPAGARATAGTYVRYDHEALIGILALEAARAGALVIGEDLGTVEPWVRDYLRARGILGTSILWFELDYDNDNNNDNGGGGRPLPPEAWRQACLASVTTHDLPPTAGYLTGDHVRLRDRLGLLTRSLAEELAVDDSERRAWLDELRRRGAFGGHPAPGAAAGAEAGAEAADNTDTGPPPAGTEATVQALYRFLTWTPARLISVALTDAVGDRRTQNQPGTLDEYPNWRVPLTGPDGEAVGLEDVLASPRAAALAEVVRPIAVPAIERGPAESG